ncbi:MAG: hypothetical protein Q4C64_02070 [Erysipelotrichia bacterium]|nr:hypothetical protein [Erysipelotrichia bacterium]
MKKVIWVLLPVLLLANLFFTSVRAEETVTVYVNAAGNDTNDGLTEENALLTLAKAAELVNADVDGKNFIIYVTSDLTMQESARFYNHNVTIVGKGEKVPVVTRGDDFKLLSDTARSWYNPAMLEIQTSASEANLTLKNIVFDDNFKHGGSIFAQAVSGEEKEDNTVFVQDAIVASNATKSCTITLDEGTVLRNFGGMSAVRVTNSAEVVMKKGSVIEDSVEYVRKKSGTNNKNEVGAAGAVWLQGGKFVMEEGAEIRNINGRAIYADGGRVELAGTISDITSNKSNMWFGDAGIVLHLRNSATALLKSTSVMDNNATDTVKVSSVVAVNGDCELVADYGAVIRNYNMTAIAVSGAATVNFDGEITNITNGGNAMNIQRDGFNITLGKNSNIHHNVSWYGTLYIQGNGTVNLYGKINDNFGTDRAGGIAMAHNLNASHVNMYDGAEICRNYSPQTGGGLMVSKGTFHMYGGTIADNVAKDVGGGIYVRNGGMVIIDGGTIENNISKNAGGGIMFEAAPWGNPAVQPYVEINDGKIINNYMFADVQDKTADKVYEYSVDKTDAKTNDVSISQKGSFAYTERCVRINNSDVLSNKDVYFVVDNKTVTAVNSSESSIWLGNANAKTVSQLKAASDDKGWGNQIASFYVYRCDKSIELKVGGLNFNENLPVFAVVLKGVDANGENEQNAEVEFYSAVVDGKDIYVTLPGTGDENSLGRDVILVQPTDDIGSVVIEGPKELLYNRSLTEYKVPYTATYRMPKGFMEAIKQVQDKRYKLSIYFCC